MRLIERESQLAALHEYAKEASQGQGRLVLISGEAGVGKSVLLEEFAQGLTIILVKATSQAGWNDKLIQIFNIFKFFK